LLGGPLASRVCRVLSVLEVGGSVFSTYSMHDLSPLPGPGTKIFRVLWRRVLVWSLFLSFLKTIPTPPTAFSRGAHRRPCPLGFLVKRNRDSVQTESLAAPPFLRHLIVPTRAAGPRLNRDSLPAAIGPSILVSRHRSSLFDPFTTWVSVFSRQTSVAKPRTRFL